MVPQAWSQAQADCAGGWLTFLERARLWPHLLSCPLISG